MVTLQHFIETLKSAVTQAKSEFCRESVTPSTGPKSHLPDRNPRTSRVKKI